MNSRKKALSLVALGLFLTVAAVACGEVDPSDLDPADSPTQFVVDLPTSTPQPPDVANTPAPVPTPTSSPPLPTYPPGVLELYGISSWINSDPFTIADKLSDDHVVLVDFWTYTCVNCLRTLPFLREWHAKYAPHPVGRRQW